MKNNLDTCIHCGSSLRLSESEFENNDPVYLPNGKALCSICYKSMDKSEYERYC